MSFLCSLDNFLLKNVIVFIFVENKFENNAYLKKGYFGPTFHMVPSEKRKKIPSAHIPLT